MWQSHGQAVALRHRTLSDSRIHADAFFVLAEIFVGYYTVYFCKKCVVTTTADIGPWMNLGSKLTNKNIACLDDLTAESLHTTPLTCTVATVP